MNLLILLWDKGKEEMYLCATFQQQGNIKVHTWIGFTEAQLQWGVWYE